MLFRSHGAYPAAIRTLAKLRGVRLIDLERITARLFEDLGEEGTKRVFCHVPAGHRNYPEGLADNSHLHEDGAVLIAELVLRLLDGRIRTEDLLDTSTNCDSDNSGCLLSLLQAKERRC